MSRDRITPIASGLCKALEIGHWVTAGMAALILVCSPFYRLLIDSVPAAGGESDSILASTYGFGARPHGTPARYDNLTVFLWGLGSTAILALVAMAFRSLWHVLRLLRAPEPSDEDGTGNGTVLFTPGTTAYVRRHRPLSDSGSTCRVRHRRDRVGASAARHRHRRHRSGGPVAACLRADRSEPVARIRVGRRSTT